MGPTGGLGGSAASKLTLRGVHRRADIGLLSLFEHYGSCLVCYGRSPDTRTIFPSYGALWICITSTARPIRLIWAWASVDWALNGCSPDTASAAWYNCLAVISQLTYFSICITDEKILRPFYNCLNDRGLIKETRSGFCIYVTLSIFTESFTVWRMGDRNGTAPLSKGPRLTLP